MARAIPPFAALVGSSYKEDLEQDTRIYLRGCNTQGRELSYKSTVVFVWFDSGLSVGFA